MALTHQRVVVRTIPRSRLISALSRGLGISVMASTLAGSGNMPSVVSIKPLYLTLCCLNLSFASLVPTTANMEHLLSPGRVLWIISVLLYLNIQGNLTFRNNSIPTGRYQLCFTPFKLWWVFYLRVVFQYKAVGCCTIVDLHLDFCPG